MLSSKKIVEALSIFEELSADEQIFIKDYLCEITYQPGEIILHQGSLGGDLFIIKAGSVSVNVTMPGGITKVATKLGEGQIFGEVAFLSDALITATIIADSDVTCLIFKHNVLEMVRTAFPAVAYKIEFAIAKQLSEKMMEHIEKILTLLHSIPPNNEIHTDLTRLLPNAKARCHPIETSTISPKLLSNISFLQLLSAEEQQTLIQFMKAAEYDKGYNFGQLGDMQNSLNLICSGAVMLFIKEDNKLVKRIDVSGIGELFIPNFVGQKFSVNTDYVTCERCEILGLSVENYNELRRLYPSIFYTIGRYVHRTIVKSIYKLNRLFVRMNCEYKDLHG